MIDEVSALNDMDNKLSQEKRQRLSTMKPNCGNCPYWIDRLQDALHDCPARYSYGIRFYEENFIPFTERVGCLSHSGAKEYLMAPVIAELDKEIQCIEDDIPEMQNLGNINKAMQTIGVLRSCIALIRDGDFEKMEE
jgi:hypothetical protein